MIDKAARSKGAQKTPFGTMARSGNRFCEACKDYKPHYGTPAKKPWACHDCKLVKK